MGYITNQPLNRGLGIRNRGFRPVPASVSVSKATDSWTRERQVKVRLVAHRTNGEYDVIYLDQKETDSAARVLVPCMSRVDKEQLLVSLLCDLSHAKLLRALAFVLRRRVRLPVTH
jgi:hypothetical protein